MAIKVKLRRKEITGKRLTLFLDFYPPIPNPKTGKPTRWKFLKLYIYKKPKTTGEREHDREMLKIAEQIRRKKENELNKPEIYTDYEKAQLIIKERGEYNFVDYFKQLADKRKKSNHDNWISAFNYLDAFTKGYVKFIDLDESFCSSFKEHLLTTKSIKSIKVSLAQNSALSYFNKFKAALKQAYKDKYLQTDLNVSVEPIKPAETQRKFLSQEELNRLVKTECKNPLLKQAALFSALTGLRFSDIKNLIWGELEYIEGQGYFIHFKQQKTKGVEALPISECAYKLLGKPRGVTDKVFDGLIYSAYMNKHLANWIGLAGITKDITFHCFRHTNATLLLSNGVDIYTVSKMLGHRELKTTQVYAKVIDITKRDASNKIKLVI